MNQKNLQTPSNSKIEIIELTIDRLSYNGGRGVGRYEGIVVFVDGTAPGDRIKAKITERKPTFWEADLFEVLEASSHRREPPCPVASVCGGCVWQHVVYEEQLEQKQGILAFALKNLKVGALRKILPSDSEWRYRNRIQVHSQSGNIGFFSKGTRNIVPIQDCLIAEQELTAPLKTLKEKSTSEIQRIEIARTTENQISIEMGRRAPEAALFSQVNSGQNNKMIQIILDEISGDPKRIADLYAGSGNITIPLSQKFPRAEVHGVELSAASVKLGSRASGKNLNIKWHAMDVADFLIGSQRFDLMVLDPPRAGCSKMVLKAIAAARCFEVFYVSCNPMTFARDAKSLMDLGGFLLDWVQPLDMFPQTEHIELVAKFSRQT